MTEQAPSAPQATTSGRPDSEAGLLFVPYHQLPKSPTDHDLLVYSHRALTTIRRWVTFVGLMVLIGVVASVILWIVALGQLSGSSSSSSSSYGYGYSSGY